MTAWFCFTKARTAVRNFNKTDFNPASVEDIRAEIESTRNRDSQYVGVYHSNNSKQRPWKASVYSKNGKSYHCGMWPTEEAAAVAHDEAALYLYKGVPPQLNFPEKQLTPTSPNLLKKKSLEIKKQNTTSRYVGVYYQRGAWNAHITVEGETIHIGRFQDEYEAAVARDKEARERCSPRVKFNFPQ